MKKLISAIVMLTLAFTLFAFSGCMDSGEQSTDASSTSEASSTDLEESVEEESSDNGVIQLPFMPNNGN